MEKIIMASVTVDIEADQGKIAYATIKASLGDFRKSLTSLE
ncbi:hypothetical protein [Clostridium botulinum]|nr:hypothetical protein [Clostridium botulinum]